MGGSTIFEGPGARGRAAKRSDPTVQDVISVSGHLYKGFAKQLKPNEGTKKKCEGIKTAIVRDVSRGMAKKSKLLPGGARSPGTRPHPADPILGQNAAS